MKRFRLLGLVLLVVFSLGAVTAASTSAALPELLGATAFPKKWTGISLGEPMLQSLSGLQVECKADTADGEQLTDTLGAYHIHFTGCKMPTGSCNSPGDNVGVILALGEYHYVDDFLGTEATLGVAILLLIEVHFACPLALILVTGHALCLVLKPLESNATHEFHCKHVSTGMPEEKHWWNDSGIEQIALLLMNLNEGAFEESAETALGTVKFLENVTFMNH
jgi:hypothetical protein